MKKQLEEVVAILNQRKAKWQERAEVEARVKKLGYDVTKACPGIQCLERL